MLVYQRVIRNQQQAFTQDVAGVMCPKYGWNRVVARDWF